MRDTKALGFTMPFSLLARARYIGKQQPERFVAPDLAGHHQLNFDCKTARVAADFDAIRDAVDHVIVGLLIKADAKHADQGFKRQRAVIGDRLPHLIKSLLAVFTAMTDRED
jgi:hypothetical protein